MFLQYVTLRAINNESILSLNFTALAKTYSISLGYTNIYMYITYSFNLIIVILQIFPYFVF